GVIKLLDQLRVAKCFFQRIEVGSLNVLNDGKLKRFLVIDVTNDDRNIMKPCTLRSAPATLTGDQLKNIGVIRRTHQEWRHHTLFTDGIGQLFELIFVKGPPWIGTVSNDEIY